jgi:hypothetical protein
MGKFETAKAYCDRALAMKPDHADARFCRATMQLREGDYAEGWPNYETRWEVFKKDQRQFLQPLWKGQPLNGARIVLHEEQGLGDSLQFLRYVPLVQAAGGQVVLHVQDNLRRIAAELPGPLELAPTSERIDGVAWHCPLMSLPAAFGTTLETVPARVPYLAVPRGAAEAARDLFWPARELKVGLKWTGSATNPKNWYRSLTLDALAPLLDVEGVHFYSLQIEADEPGKSRWPGRITELGPQTTDMADTAAQMMHLDLVITVDTSVAHLAGALARPVWILLPVAADWRWLRDREDSPWYRTARLLRQPRYGDWKSVIARAKTMLMAFKQNHTY